MKVRHPPGRSGRLWLKHRLEVASRGADLLDKKRRALQQEYRRLTVLARETEVEWRQAADQVRTWALRAAVMAGEEKLHMLAAAQPRADVAIRWRSSMGVAFAGDATVEFKPSRAALLGGSAAADAALPAARRAVEAAVMDAAARSAVKRIGAELSVTSRRQRALERRWMPALSEAAASLNERLDELEREEATRALWVREHTAKRSR